MLASGDVAFRKFTTSTPACAIASASLAALMLVATGTGGEGREGDGTWSAIGAVMEELSVFVVLGLCFLCFGELKARIRMPARTKDVSYASKLAIATGGSQPPVQSAAAALRRIRLAVEDGDLGLAEETMEQLRDLGVPTWSMRGDRSTWALCFGELITYCARVGSLDQAEHWLNVFLDAGPVIRAPGSTCCVLRVLQALARGGEFDRAKTWLSRLPSMGIEFDEKNYTTVINAYVCAGDMSAAMALREEMKAAQSAPLVSPPMPSRGGVDGRTGSLRENDSRQTQQKAAKDVQASNDTGKSWNYYGSWWQESANNDWWHSSSDVGAWLELDGHWIGEKGETYKVWAQDANSWKCSRNDKGVLKEFSVRYDETDGVYWWGVGKKFFLDPAEAYGAPSTLKWFPHDALWATETRQAKFTWHRATASATADGEEKHAPVKQP